jgi:glutathionylspermidine synthase
MQRIAATPRTNWQKTVEGQGFFFHTPEGQPYWDESAFYHFSKHEIDVLERATTALDQMCLKAVQHVIDENLFERFQIAPPFVDYVKRSWARDELTIYGRFDLCYDGRKPPKLLEYNADTPTSLLEAAVIQWFWFKDTHGDKDQFNSIHDRLIEAWKRAAGQSQAPTYFTAVAGNIEDYMTASYLRDTAMQAGLATEYIDVEVIGWNWDRRLFVDENERAIERAFKLYPWEWMLNEPFAPQLLNDTARCPDPIFVPTLKYSFAAKSHPN